MTTKEILVKARKLIEKPESWCRGALEHEGQHCAVGAILTAKYGSMPERNERFWDNEEETLRSLATVISHGPSARAVHRITYFNDHSSHDCVLTAFDVAIEKAS